MQLYYAYQPLIKTCTTTFSQYFKLLYISLDIICFVGLSSIESHKNMLLASPCFYQHVTIHESPHRFSFDVGEYTKMCQHIPVLVKTGQQ